MEHDDLNAAFGCSSSSNTLPLALDLASFSSSSNFSAWYLLVCFFSINEAFAINPAIFSFYLMALFLVVDFDDDVALAPYDLLELLDFAEDLD